MHDAVPDTAENVPLQTTEAVERWECDRREYEQRFGKTLDEDVRIGVILALAPPQVQNHCYPTLRSGCTRYRSANPVTMIS